jgi:hypothetical protein
VTTVDLLDDATRREMRDRHRPIPLELNGQCLRIACAFVMRRRPEELPPRRWGQTAEEWFGLVSERFGVRFVPLFKEELTPPPPGLWVVVVPAHRITPEGDKHALPMFGRTPQIDGDLYGRAYDNAICGLQVVPA